MGTARKKKEGIMITRVFDAPRDRVWEAWTEPERMKRWWGPKDFSCPVSRIDLQVGGKHLACMRGPDGKDYWSTGVYREIVPNERLVYIDNFADEKGDVVPASYYGMPGNLPIEMLVTVTFEDLKGKTRMVLRHEGLPSGKMSRDARIGWMQSFDKLAESLKFVEIAGPALMIDERTRIIAEPGKQEIVIERAFHAPRECIFRAFTEPGFISEWWGPRRLTTAVDKMDARSGGIWRFLCRDKDGKEEAFHGVYHDILSPERLVFTFEYEGMPGHVLLETVTLEEYVDQYVYGFETVTKMTVRDVFQSVEDRDEMIRSGMAEGVRDSYNRLDELAARLCILKKKVA